MAEGFEIYDWSMPSRQVLRVWVRSSVLPVGGEFSRVLDRSSGRGQDGTWEWRQLNCAEPPKPTVPVEASVEALLDLLVREHVELGELASMFGILPFGAQRRRPGVV